MMKQPILLHIQSQTRAELMVLLARAFCDRGEQVVILLEGKNQILRERIEQMPVTVIYFDDLFYRYEADYANYADRYASAHTKLNYIRKIKLIYFRFFKYFIYTKLNYIQKIQLRYVGFFRYSTMSIHEKILYQFITRKSRVFMYESIKILYKFVTRKLHSLFSGVKYIVFLRYHYDMLSAAKACLYVLAPKAIIVVDDGLTGNCWLLSAAKQYGIPIIDCPYAWGSRLGLETDLEKKSKNGKLIVAEGTFGEEIKKHYPHWLKKGKFEGALMFEAESILAREYLGLSIPDPWTLHGGIGDVLLVESIMMQEFYRRENIPDEKMLLTGSIYADVVYCMLHSKPEYKNAFDKIQKINSDCINILVSWPPSYDDEYSCEFGSYQELTRQVFDFLYQFPNVKITISPHPHTRANDRAVFQHYGQDVSKESLLTLIPKHDIYISIFSNTIRWAVAIAKPVISYNVYQFKCDVFGNDHAILAVNSYVEFQSVCQKVISDPEFYKKVSQDQKRWSEKWAIMDGKNFDRISDAMYNIINERSKTLKAS